MRSSSDPAALMTAEELGQLLRMSRGAVYAMVARGELPGVIKIGRRLRFDRGTVLDWLRRAPSSGEDGR